MSETQEDLFKVFLKTALLKGNECKEYLIISRDILGNQSVTSNMDTIAALGHLESCKLGIIRQWEQRQG